MQVVEWYFAVYERKISPIWEFFGHVSAFGYTADDTWVFIDPERTGVTTLVTHRHDEIEALMAQRFNSAREIIKIQARGAPFLPPFFPLTCASFCAHLVGLRAFTVGGFRKRLLRNGGQIVHENPEGRPR